MVELASLVLWLTDARSSLISLPLPKDDPKRRRPDIRIARELLGWSPSTRLKAGLERTIGYFKNERRMMPVVRSDRQAPAIHLTPSATAGGRL